MSRLPHIWFVGILLLALLAPLLANDAPLVAVVDGETRFPALASYTGPASHGPYPDRSITWHEWWIRLDSNATDWAVMPPWPYGPLMERNVDAGFIPPSLDHPLGTDVLGRDLLSRMIWGASTAAWVGIGAVLLAGLLGIVLGGLAGYFAGATDRAVMTVVEMSMCFPALFLVLAAAAFFGHSGSVVVLVLGFVFWNSFARIIRGEFLSLREREFVLAARGLGVRTPSLILRHMLPCAASPLKVQAAFVFANAIIVEATLSFLGLGTGGAESWGKILVEGKNGALDGVWHLWLFPALAVAGTVWSLHGMADRHRQS